MKKTDRSLINSLPTYIYWLDNNNTYQKCNTAFANLLNFKSPNTIIGFKNRDLICFKHQKNIYSIIDENNLIAIESGQTCIFEEIFYTLDGQQFTCLSIKSPIYDDIKQNIIGLAIMSIEYNQLNDHTTSLNLKTRNIHNLALHKIINNMPCHIYWKDNTGKYLGCNDNQARNLGFNSGADIIGKTDFELPWAEGSALEFRLNDIEVMEAKAEKIAEETSIIDRKPAIVLSQKAPLMDNLGNSLGVIGVSIDITAQKNETTKFKKIVDQMVHDIGSPIASLSMLVSTCENIPEETRIGIRESLTNIIDITQKVLNEYKIHQKPERLNSNTHAIESDKQPLIVSSTLLQILRDKRAQFDSHSLKFDYKFAKNSSFAFIEIEPSSFKRMVSNLINNAVEAINNKEGNITLTLDATEHQISISIIDDGHGINPTLLEKIKRGVSITYGKKDGHGIGLAQVRDTLHTYSGNFNIQSQVGSGTTVTITFPRIKAPLWIAEKLHLSNGDIVVILDDDSSIHTAWTSYLRNTNCEISLKHFSIAEDTIAFIANTTDKEKIVLLSDYELLNQKLNGLDVIKKTGLNRAILVTSHHSNQEIKNQAIQVGTKILPKRLASEIEIVVSDYNLFSEINESAKSNH